jgi:nitrite reductase/ring-hydroxylating ferredoxin subunit
MSYFKVAQTSDIPAQGGGRSGRPGCDRHLPAVLMITLATNDLCPHRGAPLSEGIH